MLSVTSHDTVRRARVSVVLLAAFVAGIPIAGTRPVYGQQVGPDTTPNMVGEWRGRGQVVYFENIDDPASQPQFVQTDEWVLTIGTQTGRAFASMGPDGQKLTGVILPDGTLSMHSFGGNDRWFWTGTLTVRRGRYVIEGYVHTFEDPTRATYPSMATAHFSLSKAR